MDEHRAAVRVCPRIPAAGRQYLADFLALYKG